jgi:hypothetical protein
LSPSIGKGGKNGGRAIGVEGNLRRNGRIAMSEKVRQHYYNTIEEGSMKALLKTVSLSLLMVMGMGVGTYSHGEETAAPPAAQAEAAPPAGYKLIPEDLTADFNLSLYSQYIWRGYGLSKNSFVLFPTMTVGYKGFAVNVWTDLDTRFYGTDAKEFKLQETDVTVSYSNSYQPWKLNYSLGWILYDYQPTEGEADGSIIDTKNQEIFLTLGLDTLLKPTFSVYQEIEKGPAWYFQLGVSHSFAVYKDWSLDLAGSVSYLNNKSQHKNGTNFSDFHDGNISAGLKIPLNKYLSVKPNIQYSFPLTSAASREINDGSFGHDNQFVYGGLIIDLAI